MAAPVHRGRSARNAAARNAHDPDAALAEIREDVAPVLPISARAEEPENARARRFYEKRGWRLNGNERVVPFPPHPLDVGYSIDL
jgi:hypothetical protein